MKPALDVLFWDNHLLVVDKPAGIPSVPDASGAPSMFDLAREWVRTKFGKPGEAWLGVVHRLDRPVSGVLVFARTSKCASRLALQLREHKARKTYWGVGASRFAQQAGVTHGILEQWLIKDAAKNRVRAVPAAREGARQAITAWRVLERRNATTLYEFVPQTGRPHQLRACAAALGTPLCGDLKYGAPQALADKSIALHARELELEHPTREERLSFSSLPPATAVWEFDTCRAGRMGDGESSP